MVYWKNVPGGFYSSGIVSCQSNKHHRVKRNTVASLAVSRPALPVAQVLKWAWYENTLFYSHVALFSWEKTLPPKHFFFVLCLALPSLCVPALCTGTGILKLVNSLCISPHWFMGLLNQSTRISQSSSSLVGKAYPTALTSRCIPSALSQWQSRAGSWIGASKQGSLSVT